MEVVGYLVGLVIAVVPAVFWIWTLIDVIKSDFSGNNKIIWLLVVVLLPLVGMILYWLFGRAQKTSTRRTEPTAG